MHFPYFYVFPHFSENSAMRKLLGLLLLPVIWGCNPPIPPPEPPKQACFAPHVSPPGKYAISVNGDTPTFTGEDGYTYSILPAGIYIIKITAAGFEPFEQQFDLQTIADGSCDYFIKMKPIIPPLPPLQVQGQFFTQAGAPFFLNETSDFNLYSRFLSGEYIDPILQQRKSLGFNSLRVWTQYDLSQYGIGTLLLSQHPDLYSRLPEFLVLAKRYGFYVNLTAYTGPYTWGFTPEHWTRLCTAVQGSTNVLLSLVNENDQAANNINTTPFQPCAGVLSSHGSNGSQQDPVIPVWGDGWAEFHTNDAFEWWRKVGHNGMETADLFHLPIHADENTRFPDKDSSLVHAYDSAAGAALLIAGATFHSVHGKNSTLFEGAELDAARSWNAGVASVPVVCHLAGPYKHRQDLETQDLLRVYQRGDDPNCIVRIRQ
jgi:hypothetical protein